MKTERAVIKVNQEPSQIVEKSRKKKLQTPSFFMKTKSSRIKINHEFIKKKLREKIQIYTKIRTNN